MIVKLLKEVKKEDANSYAYVCEVDRPYFVYAILSNGDGSDLSYMINVWGKSANDTIYDIPANYFDIVDNSIPSDWESDSYIAYGNQIRINSFPSMAHDKYFYSKLMDDDPETVKLFKVYADKYEDAVRYFTKQ